MSRDTIPRSWVISVEIDENFIVTPTSTLDSNLLRVFSRLSWTLEWFRQGLRSAEFVDLTHPKAQSLSELPIDIDELVKTGKPMPDLGDGIRVLPRVATVRLPIETMLFSRGREELHVEIIAVSDDLSRGWADRVLAEGDLRDLPLGRGFVIGPSFVIDMSTRLIRGLWWDGRALDSKRERIDAETRRVQNAVLDLASTLA